MLSGDPQRLRLGCDPWSRLRRPKNRLCTTCSQQIEPRRLSLVREVVAELRWRRQVWECYLCSQPILWQTTRAIVQREPLVCFAVAKFLLSANGEDRPGIVYRLTAELASYDCNLCDSAMTDLEGQFVIMLSFTGESGLSPQAIEAQLQNRLSDLNLGIAVVEIAASKTRIQSAGAQIAVRVHGGDHAGIVAGIAKVLYQFDANIVDLKTHLSTSAQGSNYLMIMVCDLFEPERFDALSGELAKTAIALNVHVSAELIEAELL